MKKNTTFLTFFIVLIFMLTNCSNDGDDLTQIELGIWISLDKKDTLNFETKNDFYKSNGYMQNDHYDYKLLSKDSIQIGYRGKLFIAVEPTNHTYSIEQDKLTIDFTNKSCYGFEDNIITYMKQ
ncbi:MAG: hypothetical protein AAGB24_05805 [Bacteroidota bacterium]